MNAEHLFTQLKNHGLDIDQPNTFVTAWQIPNESDIHAHLVPYLASLDRHDCIEAVLNAETPDGKNGWFQTRAATGQTSGFVADVEHWKSLLRARNLADEAVGERPRYLGQEARCALMLSATLSLGWQSKHEGDDTQQIEYEYARFHALQAVSIYLPTEQKTKVLRQALEAAQAIEREVSHSEQLAALAPSLPKELLEQALQTAQGIQYTSYRLMALAAIASYLPSETQSRVLEQILEAAQNSQIRQDWTWILGAIAPSLPPESLQAALKIAQRMEAGIERTLTLAVIAPQLPHEQQNQVMSQALQFAQGMEDNVYWDRVVETLAFLAQALPPDLLQVGLCAGQHRQDKPHCAEFSDVAALAPHMPIRQRSQVLDQAFNAAQSIGNEYYRSTALVTILPHLSVQLQNQAVMELLHSAHSQVRDAAQSIEHKEFWSGILAEIAPYLPLKAIQQALDLTIELILHELDIKLMDRTEESRYWALSAIAKQIHRSQSHLVYRILDTIALVKRENAFTIIAGLATPLYEIGRVEAVSETARAIDDVCRWWP